ncbi:MAG: hypothetical protein U1D98_01440 [Candidatus Gracilibacteria bacterium]|nr:hypothetical protein [Candidatus Gracilibacteria bacterium]
MTILVGVGSPVMFKASRIFRFRNDAVLIKGMMDEARSAAINLRSIPAAATAGPSSDCQNPGQEGFDTNYDGICGDTIPFNYIFEMNYDGNSDLTIRTYADFSDDQIYNTNEDILISQKVIVGDYSFSYDYILLPPPGSTYSESAPTSKTYAYAFSPQDGASSIWYYSGLTPVDLHMTEFHMHQNGLDRDFNLYIDRLSGIPEDVTP